MRSNREIIYQVRKELKEEYVDSRLTNKFIYSVLLKHSKWLIRRESDSLRITRFQDLYQTIDCIEVIEAPLIDPCCGLRGSCTIWRTKEKLPQLFEDTAGVILKRVTSVDGSTEFTATTPTSVERKAKNPWSKWDKSKYYFYDQGYLYFTERILMVKVSGLFTEDVSHLTCGERECKRFLDQSFVLPDYLYGEMIAQTLQEIGTYYKRFTTDLTIDKRDIPSA